MIRQALPPLLVWFPSCVPNSFRFEVKATCPVSRWESKGNACRVGASGRLFRLGVLCRLVIIWLGRNSAAGRHWRDGNNDLCLCDSTVACPAMMDESSQEAAMEAMKKKQKEFALYAGLGDFKDEYSDEEDEEETTAGKGKPSLHQVVRGVESLALL